MSRPRRVQEPGMVFHVTTRGNNRRPIFVDVPDRVEFLGLLEDVAVRSGWLLQAYCLMGNHYHLVLRLTAETLGDGMRRLNGEYARRFNRRHGRVEHLFGERYASERVETDSHLLEACRYAVLNPVRQGLCESASEWRWSSYRATAGLEPRPAFLRADLLLQTLGGAAPQRRYREFVASAPGRAP